MDPIALMDFETENEPRAFVSSLVRFHHPFTMAQRQQAAEDAGWNVFQFPAVMLKGGDLLSDSGTTTLTSEQFAAMLLADESYGSNYGYFKLLEIISEIFGIPSEQSEFFIFHQGRAAEHALFTQIGLLGENQIIPNNGHFDTTRANIEANNMNAIDCFSEALQNNQLGDFNGNMNLNTLKDLLTKHKENIPLVYLTITNNTGGGQPVSMENIHQVSKLCQRFNKPLLLDACRFAENAWFIKQREPEFFDASIQSIVTQCFSYCDGFTISLKKDGLSNMGGALLIKKDGLLFERYPEITANIRDHQILTEGHPTYGGLSGRNIMTICEGLKTAVTETYLESRVGQVSGLGNYLKQQNLPLLEPFGGHAIYIDMDQFLADTKLKRTDYGGISLTALLLLKGVRLCELGAFAFGDEHPKNFVRCAIPRNKYAMQDLRYVGDCIGELYKRRQQLPRAIPTYGRDLTLRHFKARFKLEAL